MTKEGRSLNPDKPSDGNGLESYLRRIERRQWWLWSSAILVTLLLTLAVLSFVVPMLRLAGESTENFQQHTAIRGLVALVLIFDVYIIYQQLQIHRFRRRLLQREEIFRLITENRDLVGADPALNEAAWETLRGIVGLLPAIGTDGGSRRASAAGYFEF